MRKKCLTILALSIVLVTATASPAQEVSVPQRESFWGGLKLPDSPFVRRTDAKRRVFFRVPVDWKEQGESVFIGPHSSTLNISLEEIPDGLAFKDYLAALMQPLRHLPGGADSLLVRRTTMSGIEAREILLEVPDVRGDLSRRIIWCMVQGPTAVALVFTVPLEHAPEVEPYFRAVVQSVVALPEGEYSFFEALRSTIIKESKPAAINEVQELAAALAVSDATVRSSSIARLSKIFSSDPDAAIDLFVDGSPMVRAAVVQAIGQSRNQSLTPLLLEAVKDRELFVSEAAARGIAADREPLNLLRRASIDWIQTEVVARVWQFLDKNKQIAILNEIFSKKVSPGSSGSRGTSRGKREEVTVIAKVIAPGSRISLPQPIVSGPEVEASRMLGALTLLSSLNADEFALNLPQLIATNQDSVVALGLNLALERQEALPVSELFKLLFSSSQKPHVRRLAALNLARSAAAADIGRLEHYLKLNRVPVTGARVGRAKAVRASPEGAYDKEVAEEVALTIRKIRLRKEILTAGTEEREKIIARELKDPKINEWVWDEFAGHGQRLRSFSLTGMEDVSTLGETLFPEHVNHYLAIPEPGVALERLEKNIGGLHLETARSQASFVLMLSVLREMLGQVLDAPYDAPIMNYTGIDVSAPISMAQWSAPNAPSGLAGTEHRAIVMRVSDRDRFERLLSLYQSRIGDFRSLTDNLGVGARVVSILPIFIPLTARAMLEKDVERIQPLSVNPLRKRRQLDESNILNYTHTKRIHFQNHPLALIEKISVTSSGNLKRDSIYVTYLGKTAVLAPDLESMSDILARISNGHSALSRNLDFKKALAASGDAIYFSDLVKIFTTSNEPDGKENERGASREFGTLNVNQTIWENSYHINSADSGWSNLLVRFKTQDLTAPRELLPKTTLAYFFLNFDLVTGWQKWASVLLGVQQIRELESILSPGFENELLPQLSGECGVALFDSPNILRSDMQLGWVAFCKLESDKLKHSLLEGKLFKGTPEQKNELFKVALETGFLYAAVKQNFLVVSTAKESIDELDGKEKLASSREFIRAAASAPADIIAFGGYNLEAAMPQITSSNKESLEAQKAAFVSSLAKAFHSTIFYAQATPEGIEARASASMDREGRFSIDELSAISKDYRPTYAVVESSGVPIFDQKNVSKLRMALRTNASGAIDRIKDEIETAFQQVEKRSEKELSVLVLSRRSEPKVKVTLPITNPDLQHFLKPSAPINSDDQNVIAKAREIVGDDRDAWSVAKKLADWTHQNLKWKKIGAATPAQTLATLEADCSEFSELYVAMARSLGLPARLVSGLAYSGNAFGGHAWVEVHIGDWIELDPTYGTTFADATHIRDTSGALLTYAALNLLEIEVLETTRGNAEYQKSARLLAETVTSELSEGRPSAIDIALLTDKHMGAGSWEKLSTTERDEMSSAFRRVMIELMSGFKGENGERLRLVRVLEDGERAEALLLQTGDLLIRLKLIRMNDAWHLAEIVQTDTGLHVIAETLRPTINSILARRTGQQLPRQQISNFVRVLIAIEQDPKIGLEVVERALKENAGDRSLRYLKALTLAIAEQNDEAIQLWRQLADEETPMLPAIFVLANKLSGSEKEEDQEQAVALYQKYIELEPYDPRAPSNLAALYEQLERFEQAETEYKRVIEIDSANSSAYLDLAQLLTQQKRIAEVATVLDLAAKISPEEDLFGQLMSKLFFREDHEPAEMLAAELRDRFDKSGTANLYLGYSRNNHEKYREAIILFRRAAILMKDSAEPYSSMAQSYRALRSWTEALAAADNAIKIAPEDGDGYYHRACALARLRRSREALQALEKAIELGSFLAFDFEEEEDLQSLSAHPRFKKLVEEFNKEPEDQ